MNLTAFPKICKECAISLQPLIDEQNSALRIILVINDGQIWSKKSRRHNNEYSQLNVCPCQKETYILKYSYNFFS